MKTYITHECLDCGEPFDVTIWYTPESSHNCRTEFAVRAEFDYEPKFCPNKACCGEIERRDLSVEL